MSQKKSWNLGIRAWLLCTRTRLTMWSGIHLLFGFWVDMWLFETDWKTEIIFFFIIIFSLFNFVRLFLLGLDKFGKGDWRSISRNFVISRTPTQVASHAQKYFIRLNSVNRDRRRSSIHDITSVANGEVSPHQVPPITGQQTNANQPSVPALGAPQQVKHRGGQPHVPGIGMYGAPMGHPVAAPPGHMGSAVGTPVLLPPGHHPHPHHPHPHHHPPPYVVPVAYPMAPPTMHQ